jgi:Family of unknown function (DUF6498)
LTPLFARHIARVPHKETPAEKPLSAWVLVAANVLPLAAHGVRRPRGHAALWLAKLLMVPFFCVHYGMFTAVHGVFVFMLFGQGKYRVDGLDALAPAARAATDYGLLLPLAVLVGSHFFSFAWNYLYRGEFRSAQLSSLMVQPYGRVVVLHVAIILGGIAAMALGSPIWALLVLLALKVALDFRAHVKEHSPS